MALRNGLGHLSDLYDFVKTIMKAREYLVLSSFMADYSGFFVVTL